LGHRERRAKERERDRKADREERVTQMQYNLSYLLLRVAGQLTYMPVPVPYFYTEYVFCIAFVT